MKTWDEFIDDIAEAHWVDIILGYEELYHTGELNSLVLRQYALQWITNLGLPNINVTTTAMQIHHAISHKISKKHLGLK